VHTASSAGVPARTPGIWLLAGAALLGGAVAVALGLYSAKHKPAGQAYFTLGFSGTLNGGNTLDDTGDRLPAWPSLRGYPGRGPAASATRRVDLSE